MKILNVIQRYHPAVGGSEEWCRQLSKYFIRQGHTVVVLTLDAVTEEDFYRGPDELDRTTAVGRWWNDGGILVRRYRRTVPTRMFHHVFYRFCLDRLCKIFLHGPHSYEMYAAMGREIRNCDVVILHTIPYSHNVAGWMSARWWGKPVIIIPHFHPGHPDYERWSNYSLLRHCDRILADTRSERSHLINHGVPPEKIDIGGIGIDPEQYVSEQAGAFRRNLEKEHGIQPGRKIIGFLGRKIEGKGLEMLLEAVRKVNERVPVTALLAGPDSPWFTGHWNRMNPDLREHIIDLGTLRHDEKVNFLHSIDLLVLPSTHEAFGIVILEAWCCGTPVLAGDIGAVREVITEGGFLFHAGDGESLTRHLIEIIQRNDLKAVGERGRALVLNTYSIDRIGKSIERCLTIIREV